MSMPTGHDFIAVAPKSALSGDDDFGCDEQTSQFFPDLCNFTNGSTVENEIREAEKRYEMLLLCLFPCLTIFGNCLVVLSVIRERSLRNATNYFIVSLAVADMMVAVLVMPLMIYVEVNSGVWELSITLCDLWIALDVMCCTASILNLTAISVDRYIAVLQPIRYARHKNLGTRVIVTILMCWLLSFFIALPMVFNINHFHAYREKHNCIFYNAMFIVLSSTGSFYVPGCLIVFLYWRIFLAIRTRTKRNLERAKAAAKKSMLDKTEGSQSGDSADLKRTCMQPTDYQLTETQPTENQPSKMNLSSRFSASNKLTMKMSQSNLEIFSPTHAVTPYQEGYDDISGEAVLIVERVNSGMKRLSRHSSRNVDLGLKLDKNGQMESSHFSDKSMKMTCTSTPIPTFTIGCEADNEDDAEIDCTVIKNVGNEEDKKCLLIDDLSFSSIDAETNSKQTVKVQVHALNPNMYEKTKADVKTPLLRNQINNPSTARLDTRVENNLKPKSNAFNGSAGLPLFSLGDGDSAVASPLTHWLNSNTSDQISSSRRRRLTKSQTIELSDISPGRSQILSRFNIDTMKEALTRIRSKKMKKLRARGEHRQQRQERKATQTLAVVLGVFMLCWIPFFSANSRKAICMWIHMHFVSKTDASLSIYKGMEKIQIAEDIHNRCDNSPLLMECFTWLGYVNSFLNPLIYTVFNVEFRKAFKSILGFKESSRPHRRNTFRK